MAAKDKLRQYEKQFNAYAERAGNIGQFEESLKNDIQAKTQGNTDLLAREQEASETLRALPSQLRSQFYTSNIRNPLAQEAIIQQRRAAPLSTLNTLTDARKERGMRFEDLLNTSLKKEQADIDNQRLSAEGLLQMYKLQQDQENFNTQIAVARRASGGGGGGGINTAAYEKAMGEQSKRQGALFDQMFNELKSSKNPVQRQQLASSMLSILPNIPQSADPRWQSRLQFIYSNPMINSQTGKKIQ